MKKSCFFFAILVTLLSCSSGYDSERIREEAIRNSHPALQKDSSDYRTSSIYGLNLATHFVAPGRPSSVNRQKSLQVLEDLANGNNRFIDGLGRHPNQTPLRRSALLSDQKPDAVILSCSDSRVPPELLFDKGLGDLFVIRTAGEIADSIALASIEYAVEHLHPKLIVVMGHSSCGAVKAAISTPEGKSTGSPHIDELIKHIHPAIKDFEVPKSDLTFIEPVKANVSLVTRNLKERSKIIQHAINTEEVLLVQAIYNLDSGKVDFWF